MKRRDFITFLIGAAVARPLMARAQQGEHLRRIGVLMPLAEDDQEASTLVSTFVNGLQEQGWTVGRNVSINYRWAAGDAQRIQAFAKELIEQNSDLILARSSPVVAALMQRTRTIPIVFFQVVDPVGQGFVASLARPGGNVTGFTIFEPTIGSKWVELLTQIAPRVARVALIVAMAARLDLPAIYPFRFFATTGGLISYGTDPAEAMRQATVYADRILKGAKPADLPVQAPTKFELVINLKTAKALRLGVPDRLLSLADEVIE
jgi:ABC-type uncharacterized transport system substrate-binding protein